MPRLAAIALLTTVLSTGMIGAVAMWRRDVAQRAQYEAAVHGYQQVVAGQARVRATLERDAQRARELLARNNQRLAAMRAAYESDTRRLEEAFRNDQAARDWRDVPLPDAVRGLRSDTSVPAGNTRARDSPAAARPGADAPRQPIP